MTAAGWPGEEVNGVSSSSLRLARRTGVAGAAWGAGAPVVAGIYQGK
jgi:hypothetical protein